MPHARHHQHTNHGHHAAHDGHDDSVHPHGHRHHHPPPPTGGYAFPIAVGLNLVFVVVEFSYGFIENSTALIADAGHNLSDVLGLLLAWGAVALARRRATARYTFGLGGASILAALANAMLLFLACGAIGWEAIHRFAAPPAVQGLTITVIATIGIVVNAVSAALFFRGRKHDLNIRGAYLHMMADAAVSLGVAIAGIAILYTGWYWLDPAISLVIVLVMIASTWGLLRESVELSLNAVPHAVNAAAVEKYLRSLEGVADVHDLHIWGLSTTESALTVHLAMPGGHPGDAFMDHVVSELKHHYRVHHSTLQIEYGTSDHRCALTSTAHDHEGAPA